MLKVFEESPEAVDAPSYVLPNSNPADFIVSLYVPLSLYRPETLFGGEGAVKFS